MAPEFVFAIHTRDPEIYHRAPACVIVAVAVN